MKAQSRIVWAIDPLSDEPSYFRHAAREVGDFAAASGAVVEPVFVLVPPRLILPLGEALSLLEPTRPEMEKRWARLMKGNSHRGRFLKPKVVQDEGLSTRSAARTLVAYAVSAGADLIAVSTHGRKGVARAFLGSFAESLLHQATLPTLVVNRKAAGGSRIKKILFPVDLPFGARGPLRAAIALAKSLKAKLVLYHKLDYVTEYTAHLLYETPMYQGFVVRDVKAKKRAMDQLKDEATAAGVSTEVVFDESWGYVADRILAMARRTGVGLIALVGQSRSVEATLLGSVTRQMVRTAGCPVWVIRPSNVKAKQAVAFKPQVISSASY